MFHRHPFLSFVTGVYLLFVAWVTLTPAAVSGEKISLIYRVLDAFQRRGYVETVTNSQLEFLANIALFVPVGMFLLLLFGAGQWWLAGLASFGMTSAIETAQRYIAGRVPSEQDVFANTAGAIVGIVLAFILMLPETVRRVRRKRRKRQVAAQSVR